MFSLHRAKSVRHVFSDWNHTLRTNAASCVKARADYDALSTAIAEVYGYRRPEFETLPGTEKQQLVRAAAAEIQQGKPQPVPVTILRPVAVPVGLRAHLADALDAAADLTSALQDALRAATTEDEAVEIMACLEPNAILACRLSQFKARVTA